MDRVVKLTERDILKFDLYMASREDACMEARRLYVQKWLPIQRAEDLALQKFHEKAEKDGFHMFLFFLLCCFIFGGISFMIDLSRI